IVGKGVVPRADDCPHGSFHVLQHLRYAVAIAVEQAADQETWDLDFVLRTHWAAPESSVMLMFEVEQRPGRRFEAWAEDFFVKAVIGCACHPFGHMHVEFEFVDVHDAVHVMHVIVEQLVSGVYSDDRFQSGWILHRHLNSVKAAPGDSHHADVAVRPGLVRKPGDDFHGIRLLLRGVLAVRCFPFTGAGSANIHASAHESTTREVRVDWIIACGGAVIFAIGQVFEDRRELLAWFSALRYIERCGKTNSIFHRYPGLQKANAVDGWRGWINCSG